MTTERRRMKSNVFGLACALVILALCATGSRATAREDKVEESVLTGAGSLDIVRVGGERPQLGASPRQEDASDMEGASSYTSWPTSCS